MLTDYNGRLAGEMDERKRVTRLLQDFTQSQKDLLAQAERTLEVRLIIRMEKECNRPTSGTALNENIYWKIALFLNNLVKRNTPPHIYSKLKSRVSRNM